jgi:hypothetical protein
MTHTTQAWQDHCLALAADRPDELELLHALINCQRPLTPEEQAALPSERHEQSEEQFIRSWLTFYWDDIFRPGKGRDVGFFFQSESRYFPQWQRRGLSDKEFWQRFIVDEIPRLRASYIRVLADKDDYLLWKNDWKTWMAQQRVKASAKPAQTTMWKEVAA